MMASVWPSWSAMRQSPHVRVVRMSASGACARMMSMDVEPAAAHTVWPATSESVRMALEAGTSRRVWVVR